MSKVTGTSEVLPVLFEHFDLAEIITSIEQQYPKISDFTFQFEGGYVNDPNDSGGCTNMGITIGTLTSWRGTAVTCEDVKALTKMEAQLIYAVNYWKPVYGNKTPIGVNAQMYDWGVNSGPSVPIKAAQRIIGSPDDGVMGPNTLGAINSYASSPNGVQSMILNLQEARQNFYESLSSFSRYGKGWTARNEACTDLALELASAAGGSTAGGSNLNARVSKLETWAKSFGVPNG